MIANKVKVIAGVAVVIAVITYAWVLNAKFDSQLEKIVDLSKANATMQTQIQIANQTNKDILDRIQLMQDSMTEFNVQVKENETNSKTLVNKITREVIIQKTQGDNKAATKLVNDEFNSFLGGIGK